MARDLVRQDDVVDNLNKEIFRIALEIGDDHDRREWAMTMILVARAIERIGDNCVDIGEQVAFIVTGLFREFQDASHPGEPVPSLSAGLSSQGLDRPQGAERRARRVSTAVPSPCGRCQVKTAPPPASIATCGSNAL